MLSRKSFSEGTYKRSIKRHSNPIKSLAGEASLDLFLINSAKSVLYNKPICREELYLQTQVSLDFSLETNDWALAFQFSCFVAPNSVE